MSRAGVLPVDLVEAINTILSPSHRTDDLFQELAAALRGYSSRPLAAASRALKQQRRDAVRRIIKTATVLRRDMRRADAVFIRGRRSLPSVWAPLDPHLQVTIDRLTAWLPLWDDRPRRRGNPHAGRDVFRVCVLGALQDAGLRITDPKGKPARIVALLLQELDRRDGITPQERPQFSGTQWKGWIDELRQVDAQVAAYQVRKRG